MKLKSIIDKIQLANIVAGDVRECSVYGLYLIIDHGLKFGNNIMLGNGSKKYWLPEMIAGDRLVDRLVSRKSP